MEEEFNLSPIFNQEDLLQLHSLLVLLPASDGIKQKINQSIDSLVQREASLSQKVFQLLDSAALGAFEENNLDSAELQRKNAKMASDLKKAWNLLELSHQKEVEQNTIITDLSKKIDNMMSNGNDLQLLTYSQENKELKLERNDFAEQARQSFKDKAELTIKLKKMDELLQTLMSKDSQRENDMINMRNQLTQAEYSIMSKDDELLNLKGQSDYKDVEIKSKNELISYLKEEVKKIEKILDEERKLKDITFKDLEVSNSTVKKLESQVKALKKERSEMESKAKIVEFEMKTQEKDYEQLALDKLATDRIKDGLSRKIQHFESKRLEMKLQLDTRESHLFNIERELVGVNDEIKRLTEDNKMYTHSNEKLKSINVDLQDKIALLQDTLHQNELDISTQKKSSKTFQEEAIKMRSLIEAFENQKDDYELRLSSKQKQATSLTESVHQLKSELWEQSQKTGEFKHKLSTQQNLYEQARSDRNRYAKDVMDSSAELKDSQVKFEAMTHQINQLEQQIHMKNELSTKEHFTTLKLAKDKDLLVNDMDIVLKQSKILKDKIEELKAENRMISQTSNNYCDESAKTQNKLNDYIRKTEVQQQLIEKKTDIVLSNAGVIERLENLNNKSQALLNDNEVELKSLKEELKTRSKKIRLMELHGMNTTKLQQEIIELKKGVLFEQLRNKALEDEMSRPQNIHRWRSIKAVDPDKYLLMEKVADLQRRTFKKDDEILKRDEEVDRLNKLNVELNKVLGKVPAADIVNQVEILKSTVQQRTDAVRALESEVKMYRGDLELKIANIDELKKLVAELKTRYIIMKRKSRRGTVTRS